MNDHNENSSLSGTGRWLYTSQFNDVFRIFLFSILSAGPIPNHIAFIMDGNRRYAKKENLDEGGGHEAGHLTLMSMLRYCYELRVKYVSIYAFSIDNFKRNPNEVQRLMDLLLEKMEGLLLEESIVNEYGIRVYFIGDLELLNEPVKISAEKIMRATANNTKCVLLVCVAYTSKNEIVHAVKESCADKRKELKPLNSATTSNVVIKDNMHNGHEANKVVALESRARCNSDVKNNMVRRFGQGSSKYTTANGAKAVEMRENMSGMPSVLEVGDIEKHLHMSVAPDPDLLIRSSGETRLSNFLLWQSSNCSLYSPKALWPEISLRHLVWGIITYQRNHSYLEKRKKKT